MYIGHYMILHLEIILVLDKDGVYYVYVNKKEKKTEKALVYET